jgi:hypothetical protein
MTSQRKDAAQGEGIEQIEDLAIPAVANAEEIKGGFNPQPDPPKVGVYQPPVFWGDPHVHLGR